MKPILRHLAPFGCAAALVGCIGSGSSTGTVTATWSLKNINGSPAACASGFDTMKVSAFAWSADFDAVEPGVEPVVGLFDCAAGSGTLEVPVDGSIGSVKLNGKFDIQFDETDSTGGTSIATDMQSQLSPAKINFLPAHPKVAPDPDLAAILKSANIIEIDDKWAGDNRKRIVERWIAEVLNSG